MIKVLRLSVLLLVLATFTGCEFKDITLERVDSFKINKMNKDGMEGTISLVITNPNNYPIKVKKANFDLFSGTVKVGDAQLNKSFKIKSNTTETYAIELTGNMPNLIAGGLTGLIGALRGQNPQVNIKGELKAGTFLVSKTIPVDVKTEIPLDNFIR